MERALGRRNRAEILGCVPILAHFKRLQIHGYTSNAQLCATGKHNMLLMGRCLHPIPGLRGVRAIDKTRVVCCPSFTLSPASHAVEFTPRRGGLGTKGGPGGSGPGGSFMFLNGSPGCNCPDGKLRATYYNREDPGPCFCHLFTERNVPKAGP
ncbi:hypothetical protein J6590_004420 [Homalodisca vitripennis]|nr:hypothetical protein J6590_004420 [Homalodisca vitripennis]